MTDWKKMSDITEQLLYELGINNKIIGIKTFDTTIRNDVGLSSAGIRTIEIRLEVLASDDLSKVNSLEDVVYTLNRQDKK